MAMMTNDERKKLADALTNRLPDNPKDAFVTSLLIAANVAVCTGHTKSMTQAGLDAAWDQMKSANRGID